MSIQEHLRVLRERWKILIGAVVLLLMAGIAFIALRPPQYTASLQMYVSSPSLTSAQSAYFSAAQLAQNRVKSYGALATSPRVLSQAIAEAQLSNSVEELQGRVSASTSDDSVLITINVEDSSPARAATTADAIGRALSATVSDLESASGPGQAIAPPLAVRTVEPAPVPLAESSSSPRRVLGISALLGLALGVGLALARNATDNSVKSPEQLAALLDVPNLGQITYDSGIGRDALVVLRDSSSSAAEDFRRLRTNLQFIEADKQRKILMVCSALAGEGKTTTVANLSIALAVAGYRVLLIDADLRRPAVADLLSLDGSTGLTSVLAGRLDLLEAITPGPVPRLDVLPCGPIPPNPSELLASSQNSLALERARQRYDVVLLDTPPLLPVSDAAALAPLTDAAILVCRAHRTSSVQVRRAAHGLRAAQAKIAGTVLGSADRLGGRRSLYGSNNSRYGKPVTTAAQSNIIASTEPASTASSAHDSGRYVQDLGNGRPSGVVRAPSPYPINSTRRDQPNDAGTENLRGRWNGE